MAGSLVALLTATTACTPQATEGDAFACRIVKTSMDIYANSTDGSVSDWSYATAEYERNISRAIESAETEELDALLRENSQAFETFMTKSASESDIFFYDHGIEVINRCQDMGVEVEMPTSL